MQKIFEINYQLSKKQSVSVERIANNRGMTATEVLGEVTNRAVDIVIETLLKPWSNPVADAVERGLRGIAVSAGKDVETVKDELMDSRKAAKYKLDRAQLQAYQRHITRQRAGKK